MRMLTRFKDIMASNFNAMLDKLEDPSKMVDQMLRNAIEDLAIVKKETAEVMAEEKRCKRIVDEINESIAKYDMLAMKAVTAGNDADATVFLQEKAKKASGLSSAQSTYQSANENATKMRQMHDKLTDDIQELKRRQGAIKATISVAKTQSKINKMGGVHLEDSLSKFGNYEAKAQAMLDKAEAEAELNSSSINKTSELENKYTSSGTDVSDELAKLKARMAENQY